MADFMYDFGEGEVLSHRHPNGGGFKRQESGKVV